MPLKSEIFFMDSVILITNQIANDYISHLPYIVSIKIYSFLNLCDNDY